jgi:pimeloyl-ACP methyl ester carboxylesterase
VDALGFGRSPWPEAGYTLDDQLGALRRTLVSLDATEDVTFIAHSFGTLLAVEYGSRHPNEIEHLVLLGTPVFTDEKDARARIREISPVAAFFSFNRIFAREACMAMCAFRPLLEKVLPPLEPRIPRQVVADAVLHHWPAVDGALRKILLTHPIAVPLARIGPKVTFVHGRCDGITPLSRVRELAAETGARLIETGDEHLSYPARSAAVVMAAVESR